MDTDGSVCKSNPGAARFCTVSKQLADDVVFVVETLGGTAVVYTSSPAVRKFPGNRAHQCRGKYDVEIRLPSGVIPFKLSRKRNSYLTGKRGVRRSITSIEPAGTKDCLCIKVEALDGLYLTDHCIVTHNSDDPRKGPEWYAKQREELSAVVVAQEIDIDYSASVEGVIIPRGWVLPAIDAHLKLGIEPSGERSGSLDIADGQTIAADNNAFCGAYGILLEMIEEWAPKGDDIFGVVERAFRLCDEHGYGGFRYDADGLGAGARGDARIINDRRRKEHQIPLTVQAFRGSAAVIEPEREDEPKRKNKDFFGNLKAQSWWSLRRRFRNTHRWVVGDENGVKTPCSPDAIISISSKIPSDIRAKLVNELSQPTLGWNDAGKMIVNKTPDGSRSPNLGDVVMMRFGRLRLPMIVPDEVLDSARRAPRRPVLGVGTSIAPRRRGGRLG
jgi:hypothetical protein